MIIVNAKDTLLTQNPGTLPNMSDALFSYFQPMVFTTIVKTVVNFNVVETPTDVNFLGVWQPFSAQQLAMKPIGQRAWSWFMLHASPGLVLVPDEVVNYLGVQYRVMDQSDYRAYGYVEYHLTDDYTGSGPG